MIVLEGDDSNGVGLGHHFQIQLIFSWILPQFVLQNLPIFHDQLDIVWFCAHG
jgi:hypothetical protein